MYYLPTDFLITKTAIYLKIASFFSRAKCANGEETNPSITFYAYCFFARCTSPRRA